MQKQNSGFRISGETSPNYLAKIVKLQGVKKLEGSDFLQTVVIDFQQVITGLEAANNKYYVYFPVECAINKDYLSWSNSFEDKSLNSDVEKKGFFNKHGRVRAVKMRGTISQGYIIPQESLIQWLQTKSDDLHFNTLEGSENLEFDYYGDIKICEKYIPAGNQRSTTAGEKDHSKRNKLKNILIDNQFKFYEETPHLKKCIYNFNLDDLIVITSKFHGSSFIGSNVLVKRNLSLIERLLTKFGIKIPKEQYSFIWSSGKPKSNLPKGLRLSIEDKDLWQNTGNSFYKEDIWKKEFDKISHLIPTSWNIYGEVVGHGVQGEYTYGVSKEERTKLYVYQITITNSQGLTHTLDWFSLKEFCIKYGLNHVEELFIGKLSEFGENYEEIIENLSKKFLDKALPNGLPDEGVCISTLKDKKWYKLKSNLFTLKETIELDKDVVDVETES